MARPNFDDYVDVAQRIREFYAKYPDGRLTTEGIDVYEIGDASYITVIARAYRSADDPVPGRGTAWEPVPGRTSFTKDSELMNAETSAWGRAIVALGFETKHIASANEVRNRQDDSNGHRPNVDVGKLSGMLAEAGIEDKPTAIASVTGDAPGSLKTQKAVAYAVELWAMNNGVTEDIEGAFVEAVKAAGKEPANAGNT